MPELPEVETVRRGLLSLIGHQLTAVEIRTQRLRFDIPSTLNRLEGQTLDRIDRRAKYLLFRFGDTTVLSHLGMTGTWQTTDRPIKKHDHLIWQLGDTRLIYNDPRKFGFIDVFNTNDEATHPRLKDLGPEPLSDAFSAAYLRDRLEGRKAAIKALLMDQAIVVGVGNIYAQEALYRARVSPKKHAGKVRSLEALVAAIKEILHQAIALGGSSIDDFRQANGQSGYMQNAHAVYGKAKQPCPSCGLPLSSARVGGRGTVYCRRCQK